MKHIVLVGCCAEKLGRCAPARELYRSPLFRMSADWAQRNGDDWRILSAKYGVTKPDWQGMPYDFSMRSATPEQREAWAQQVAYELWVEFDGAARFTLLAGATYATWIKPGMQVDQPMAGMAIGKRLQWLAQQKVQPPLFAEIAI